MQQSVKLTNAIWLLQLVISSPLIHALGDPSQAPTGIQTCATACHYWQCHAQTSLFKQHIPNTSRVGQGSASGESTYVA